MTDIGTRARDPSSTPRTRLLSLDVEDVVTAAVEFSDATEPAGYRSTLDRDLRSTLALLADTGARATFFVSARGCRECDSTMREIVAGGHELASYGFRHNDVRRLSTPAWRDDLMRSLETLSRYQPRISGYRPPSFTMPFDEDHLRVLSDMGLEYVSCGAAVPRAPMPSSDRPLRLPGGVTYVPVTVWTALADRLCYPVGYGHVARLLPEPISPWLVRWFGSRRAFFHFYFHPYEVAGISPHPKRLLYDVTGADLVTRLYSQRCAGRARLFRRILSGMRFRPISSFVSGGRV